VNHELEQAFEKRPLYTVPIPARDEEKTIAATVNAALNLDWPDLEVIAELRSDPRFLYW